VYAEKNPTIKSKLNPDTLVAPSLYLNMLKLKYSYELKIPTNQERANHETILEVEKDVEIIANRWKETNNFHDSNETLSMVYKDDYTKMAARKTSLVQGIPVRNRDNIEGRDNIEDGDDETPDGNRKPSHISYHQHGNDDSSIE
jgi:hypothetical protein